MSFQRYQTHIREGDTVILYMSNHLHALDVFAQKMNKKGEWCENIYQSVLGSLKIRSLIGARFGSRVELTKGWAHVLQPTPELWSLTLPHRTQIIYPPDIATILLELDLSPGHVVIEAGTGSGSLSHSIIRRIRPGGHLYTFDFHEYRARIAHQEFVAHGLDEWVCSTYKDVLRDGFGEELYGEADSVFLDLPRPWECVAEAVKVFKDRGGRFCSFSPCIEQVQHTTAALKENGFIEVGHIKILQYQMKVIKRGLPVRDLSFLRHKGSNNPVGEKPESEKPYVMATLPTTMPGHTGYITVGILPPLFRREKRQIRDSERPENDYFQFMRNTWPATTAFSPKIPRLEDATTSFLTPKVPAVDAATTTASTANILKVDAATTTASTANILKVDAATTTASTAKILKVDAATTTASTDKVDSATTTALTAKIAKADATTNTDAP